VLVSAVNEELDRMSALPAFQVFLVGFLPRADAYEMGVPAVPLGRLYSDEAWRRFPSVSLRLREPVESLAPDGLRTASGLHTADFYICALPPDRLAAVAPALAVDTSWIAYSPITGIHLWFDRPVIDLPHATLLDRTMQWVFNKDGGRYVQLVVSASRSLVEMPRADIISLAMRELADFFPRAAAARLERAHVIKEFRATFSAAPGTDGRRPPAETAAPGIFLAGDWTRTGWPATMEGAVRSGYLAANAVARAAAAPAIIKL
ncbi:MAG: FAD-dependent oxidoreductase, partial [Bryobacteraceae bacterium]